MDQEEYEVRRREIEFQARKAKTDLLIEYVDLNNTYNIGDTITDHIGSIVYEKMEYTTTGYNNIPTPIYIGTEIKKDGSPKKRKTIRELYGCNIIKNS